MKDSVKRFFAFRRLASWHIVPGSSVAGEATGAFIMAMLMAAVSIHTNTVFLTWGITIMPLCILDCLLQLQMTGMVFKAKKDLPIEIGTYKRYIWTNWLMYPIVGILLLMIMYSLVSLISQEDCSSVTILWIIAIGLTLPNSLILFNKSQIKKSIKIPYLTCALLRVAQNIIMFRFYFGRNPMINFVENKFTYVICIIAWIATTIGIIASIFGFVNFVIQIGKIKRNNYDIKNKSQAMSETLEEQSASRCGMKFNPENSISEKKGIFNGKRGKSLSLTDALKYIGWKTTEGIVIVMLSTFICYPIYGNVMGFRTVDVGISIENTVMSYVLYMGLVVACIFMFQNVFSALGDRKNNVDALPIEIGRFIKNKVMNYMLAYTALMGVVYVAKACLSYQSLSVEMIIRQAATFYIIMFITAICGCMKTVVEALGAMVCAHVLSMMAIVLYMFLEKSTHTLISALYLVAVLASLYIVMVMLISKRERKKNGCFG